MKTKIYLYKSDNIEALKKFKAKPNIIYMDPPYNTWNKGLLYDDAKNKDDWKNNFLSLLTEINNICAKNAAIFISIGQQELANAILSVEKIFGKKSIISIMPRRTHSGHKTSKTISLLHDFVISVKKGTVTFNGIKFELKAYKNEDKHVKERGPYQIRRIDYKEFKWSNTMDIPIEIEGIEYFPGAVDRSEWEKRIKDHSFHDWSWIWSKEKIEFALKNEFAFVENGKLFKKTYTKVNIVRLKNGKYEIKKIDRTKQMDSLNFVDKNYALKTSKNKPESLFDYPKSDELLIDLLSLPKFEEKIVLDPFGGTGTTAIAADILNLKEVHIIQRSEPTSPETAAYKSGFKDIFKLTKENIKDKTKGELIIK